MPNGNNAAGGKSGTITPEEYTRLTGLVGEYGALVVGSKISKICTRMSAGYLHEFPNSPVGKAWSGLALKISAAMGGQTRAVSSDNFSFLSGLVTNYGPEVIVRKVAKIAGKNGNAAQATTLKALFPVSSATTSSRAA